MLCNTAGLTGYHVGAADIVEQGGLTVVDVTHDVYDGRTGQQAFLVAGVSFLLH